MDATALRIRQPDVKVGNQIFRNGIVVRDLQLIDHFSAPCRKQKVSGAARRLKMRASNVSSRVAEPETQPGFPLNEGSAGSLRLTDIGLEVLERLRAAELRSRRTTSLRLIYRKSPALQQVKM